MKYLCLVFTVCLLSFNTQAQNLIPNPSFETFSSCPGNTTEISKATGWYSPTAGSSDYFNSCATSLVGTPKNAFGFQPSRTGVAYAGIFLFADYPTGNTFREYLQIKLITPLEANKNYVVSFYMSLGDNQSSSWYDIGATDDIGAYLSVNAIADTSSKNLLVIPQVSNANGNFLTDTVGWTLVSGSFMAQGGEEFLTIGNFKANPETDVIIIDTNFYRGSYYYIDDISVIKDTGTFINNISAQSLKIYPNPAKEQLSVELPSNINEADIVIENFIGQVVFKQSIKSNGTINLHSLKGGIYLITVQCASQLYSQKIIINP